MIFVDTNVVMYAVGGVHPLRSEARRLFEESQSGRAELVTSAEVLQELFHAYLRVGRIHTLDSALALVDSCFQTIWPVEPDDVRLARVLVESHPALGARDLIHLACCRRRGTDEVRTYDRALAAAFAAR